MGYTIDWAAGFWSDPSLAEVPLSPDWDGSTATALANGVSFDLTPDPLATDVLYYAVPITFDAEQIDLIPVQSQLTVIDPGAVLLSAQVAAGIFPGPVTFTGTADGEVDAGTTEVSLDLIGPIPAGEYILLLCPGAIVRSDNGLVYPSTRQFTVGIEPTFDCSMWEPDPACITDAWAALTEDVKERSLLLATSSLQALTYNRVGTCPITIRPCPKMSRCGCDWNPHIRNGQWVNDCAHRGQCKPLSEIDIPGPVGYIESLLIDGVAQDLWGGDWRLDNGHLLVWQGVGASPIPETQNLNRPDTESGTWSITYSRSYPVGKDARLAVALLAMEFAKACKPAGKCALPKGVTNVVRNGVSFTVEAGLFPGGLTSIEIVDQFILKWAPAGSPTRTATVYDPSKRGARRVSSVPRRSTS